MGFGKGVLEPDGMTVVVPELTDFGSPDRRLTSLERERDIGRGFSMSWRAGRPSSSSLSSSDVRKRGSLSKSSEPRDESASSDSGE